MNKIQETVEIVLWRKLYLVEITIKNIKEEDRYLEVRIYSINDEENPSIKNLVKKSEKFKIPWKKSDESDIEKLVQETTGSNRLTTETIETIHFFKIRY